MKAPEKPFKCHKCGCTDWTNAEYRTTEWFGVPYCRMCITPLNEDNLPWAEYHKHIDKQILNEQK